MKFAKSNTDNDLLEQKLRNIEIELGISIYVALEQDENGIYPVLKYYKIK